MRLVTHLERRASAALPSRTQTVVKTMSYSKGTARSRVAIAVMLISILLLKHAVYRKPRLPSLLRVKTLSIMPLDEAYRALGT